MTALDGLPLALDQAGAYIEETHCSLAHYLISMAQAVRNYYDDEEGFQLITQIQSLLPGRSLFKKWNMKAWPAADLLHLLAFLDPEAIPEEIIIKGAAELGTALEPLENDLLQVDTIIELLLRYSLIRRNSKSKSLKIHRLVQAVLKDSMDKATQRLWAERAMRAVNRIFPDVN